MNKMEQSESLEIFYWKNRRAIVIPSKSLIFFEDVKPFKPLYLDDINLNNSTFIYSDDYINKDNIKHWVVFCPTICDTLSLIIPKKDFELIPLDTKEGIYNIMKILPKYHYVVRNTIEEIIKSEL